MSALGGIGGRLYRGEVSVDFVGRRRLWYSISGAILAISAVGLLVFGLNFSVDFKGGSLFKFPTGTESISQVRRTVSAAGGGSDAIIQQVTDIANGKSDWNVQTHPLSAAQQSGSRCSAADAAGGGIRSGMTGAACRRHAGGNAGGSVSPRQLLVERAGLGGGRHPEFLL